MVNLVEVVIARGADLPISRVVDGAALGSGELLLKALGVEHGASAYTLTPHNGRFSWTPVIAAEVPPRIAENQVQLFMVEPAQSAPVPHGIGRSFRSVTLELLQSFWSACRSRKPGDLRGHVAVEEWLILSKHLGINAPRRKGIYVRECFQPFLKSCLEALEGDAYVHVTGAAGLGKSAFLWYVIMMAGAVTGNPEGAATTGLKLDYDILVQLVVHDRTTAWVGFFRDGSVDYSYTTFIDLFERFDLVRDFRVLHLVDQKFTGYHLGKVMVFASPDDRNIALIDKTGGSQVVTKVLPPWRIKEKSGFYELMKVELGLEKCEVQNIVQKWGYVLQLCVPLDPKTDLVSVL